MRLTIAAPPVPGRFSLIVDVVEEGSVWFGSRHPEGRASVPIDLAEGGDGSGPARPDRARWPTLSHVLRGWAS